MRRDRKKDNRGGSRPGAGRPKETNPAVSFKVSLKQSVVDTLTSEEIARQITNFESHLNRLAEKAAADLNAVFHTSKNFQGEINSVYVTRDKIIVWKQDGFIKLSCKDVDIYLRAVEIVSGDSELYTWLCSLSENLKIALNGD